MTLDVDDAVPAPHRADDMGVDPRHQGARSLQPVARIVITRTDHRDQSRPARAEFDEAVVEKPLGFPRRVQPVEDIARDEQCVGTLIFDEIGQARQPQAMLGLPRPAVQ